MAKTIILNGAHNQDEGGKWGGEIEMIDRYFKP